MPIEKAILKEFPDLNDTQKEAIGHTDGPLLVIAGPGSGKTLILVLRCLNLLLRGAAEPEEIILCTFTEKAAFELRDRLSIDPFLGQCPKSRIHYTTRQQLMIG